MATVKKAVGKKAAGKKAAEVKKSAAKKQAAAPRSMPKEGRDPKGGLTAKGREYFNKKEGSHLRPGVTGPADTPEKMVRKGSFLRRHFANPRGPMKNDKGEPTRLALSAHAWGEPVPQSMGDAKKLAAEGHELLEQYHELKDGTKGAAKKTASKKSAAKRGASKKSVATKSAAKKGPVKKSAAKKAAGKKAAAKRSTRRG